MSVENIRRDDKISNYQEKNKKDKQKTNWRQRYKKSKVFNRETHILFEQYFWVRFIRLADRQLFYFVYRDCLSSLLLTVIWHSFHSSTLMLRMSFELTTFELWDRRRERYNSRAKNILFESILTQKFPLFEKHSIVEKKISTLWSICLTKHFVQRYQFASNFESSVSKFCYSNDIWLLRRKFQYFDWFVWQKRLVQKNINLRAISNFLFQNVVVRKILDCWDKSFVVWFALLKLKVLSTLILFSNNEWCQESILWFKNYLLARKKMLRFKQKCLKKRDNDLLCMNKKVLIFCVARDTTARVAKSREIDDITSDKSDKEEWTRKSRQKKWQK